MAVRNTSVFTNVSQCDYHYSTNTNVFAVRRTNTYIHTYIVCVYIFKTCKYSSDIKKADSKITVNANKSANALTDLVTLFFLHEFMCMWVCTSCMSSCVCEYVFCFCFFKCALFRVDITAAGSLLPLSYVPVCVCPLVCVSTCVCVCCYLLPALW